MRHPSARLVLQSALCVGFLFAGGITSASETKVSFIQPENFTDARLDRPSGGADRIVLNTMQRHLQQLGGRCLPAGQALDIRIHDIDLAGQVAWWHGPSGQTRVMSEATWPRIKLAYSLQEGAQSGAETRQELSEINYLMESPYVRAESTPLPYERAMLTRWFEREFCTK